MCETVVEVGAEAVASCTRPGDPDQGLDSFPLLRTRLATRLISRSRAAHFLVSDSPPFRLLMLGSSISMLGSRISTVAFPMLVLHLYNSPFVTGLVAFAAIAPSMLVYVPAGVLVDRWNPRRVMLVSETLRGVAIASVVIGLTMFRQYVNIWFLICVMVIEEILEIFSMLADRRYLSGAMERDMIESRQASIEVRAHAVVLAGRPVGPFLFVIQPFLPFLADAASFCASIASLLLLRRNDEPQGKTRRRPSRRVLIDIRKGFGWLKQDRRARLTVLLMALTSMVAQALILMFLVLAHSKQMSTIAIGVVLAASGAGGAVGSFCSRRVLAEIRGVWLPIQMIVWSVVLVVLTVAGSQSAFWCAAAMFILGLTGAIGNVEFGTYVVREVADNMIATVTGIGQMLAIGACAIGPVLGGAAIQRFHVQVAIGILCIFVLLLAGASLLMPDALKYLRRDVGSIRQVIASALASGVANLAEAGAAAGRTSSAGPEPNRDNGHKFVPHSEPISLREANSRP